MIEEKLRQRFSPEQISGWLLNEHEKCLSHETIYRHLWTDKKTGAVLYRFFRRRGKRYQWRGNFTAFLDVPAMNMANGPISNIVVDAATHRRSKPPELKSTEP